MILVRGAVEISDVSAGCLLGYALPSFFFFSIVFFFVVNFICILSSIPFEQRRQPTRGYSVRLHSLF